MEAGAAIYFAKHHADDGWLHKAHRLQQVPPGPLGDLSQPGRRTLEGIELEVPAPLQAGWVLELSPDPLRQICVGYLGTGARASASYQTLEHFGSGTVFVRLRSSRAGDRDGPEVMAMLEPPHTAPRETGTGSTG